MAQTQKSARRASRSRGATKRAATRDARSTPRNRRPREEKPPRSILVIDIGGSKVKVLATGQTEPRKIASGRRMTPEDMVEAVKKMAKGWDYEAVSIGYPGLVGDSGPRSEPRNLASGWVGFDYAAAFGCPVRIVNDAVMQAIGSYEGGRMLFLGLGTGLGSALIAEYVVVSLELGQLPLGDGRTYGEVLARVGLRRLGKKIWRKTVTEVATAFLGAFVADYVVLGGGNARQFKELPAGLRLGHNRTAFRGGFRLWHLDDLQTLNAEPGPPSTAQPSLDWRLI